MPAALDDLVPGVVADVVALVCLEEIVGRHLVTTDQQSLHTQTSDSPLATIYRKHFRNSIKNFLRPITSLSTHCLFDVERGALEEGPHELVRVPGDGVGSSNEIFIDVSVLVPCRDIYCLLHPRHNLRFSTSPGEEPPANN